MKIKAIEEPKKEFKSISILLTFESEEDVEDWFNSLTSPKLTVEDFKTVRFTCQGISNRISQLLLGGNNE